jgi:hypothetical protein
MTNFNKSFQRIMGNLLEEHSTRTFGKKIHKSIQRAPNVAFEGHGKRITNC